MSKKIKLAELRLFHFTMILSARSKDLSFILLSQAIPCPVQLVCNCVKSAVSRKVVPFREIGFGNGGRIDAGYWELLS